MSSLVFYYRVKNLDADILRCSTQFHLHFDLTCNQLISSSCSPLIECSDARVDTTTPLTENPATSEFRYFQPVFLWNLM